MPAADPCHSPPGLTRTSGQHASAPSRDGRSATLRVRRWGLGPRSRLASALLDAKWGQLSSATRSVAPCPSREGAPAGGPMFASARRPARTLAAGIVAASMARRCQAPHKTHARICPNCQAATSEDGRGTLRSEVLRRRPKAGGHERRRVPHRPPLRLSRHATAQRNNRTTRATSPRPQRSAISPCTSHTSPQPRRRCPHAPTRGTRASSPARGRASPPRSPTRR